MKIIYIMKASILYDIIINSNAVKIDSDKLSYATRKIQESGGNIFGENPYEKMAEPETIIDINPNSQTYLQS